MRPRVALVVDRPDWAFANIARNLVRYLSDQYDFTVIPNTWTGDLVRTMLATRDADLVHFFWRGDAKTIYSDEYREHVGYVLGDQERFMTDFVDGRRTSTAVYDHLFLDDEEVGQWESTYRTVTAYYTCSQRLDTVYRGIGAYPDPIATLPDGVDLDLFRPVNLSRLEQVRTRPLVVGWAGNSLWSAEEDDPKGFHTILKPVIEQLNREGFEIVGRFADRMSGHIPHRSMPDYYAGIDVYVCPSAIEGTPNPVLEAMACGVPVVTTDVGVVPEVFGPLQKAFILAERSQDALAGVLRSVMTDPDVLVDLSRENLSSITSWDWSYKARDFAPFFEAALDQ